MDFLGRQNILREPTFRASWEANPGDVYASIGTRCIHVEALWIFMTGAVQAGTCARCLDHEGPFPFCVVNPHRGSCNQCANCWWVAGHRKRAGCSLRRHATTSYQMNAPPNRDPLGLTPFARETFSRLMEPAQAQLEIVRTMDGNAETPRADLTAAIGALAEEAGREPRILGTSGR